MKALEHRTACGSTTSRSPIHPAHPCRTLLAVGVALLALSACGSGRRSFEEPVELGGVAVAPGVLNRGEMAYMRHCRGCHGQRGGGDGPYASTMQPRPADLTIGEYPRLGATGGELPSDEAIRGAIEDGIEGTGMVPQNVADDDLEAVVQYVKTLAPVWRE